MGSQSGTRTFRLPSQSGWSLSKVPTLKHTDSHSLLSRTGATYGSTSSRLRRSKPNPALACTIGGRSVFDASSQFTTPNRSVQLSRQQLISNVSASLRPSVTTQPVLKTVHAATGEKVTARTVPAKSCLKRTQLKDFRPKTRTKVRFNDGN